MGYFSNDKLYTAAVRMVRKYSMIQTIWLHHSQMGGVYHVMMMSLHSGGTGFSNRSMLCHTIKIDFLEKYLKILFGPGTGLIYFQRSFNTRPLSDLIKDILKISLSEGFIKMMYWGATLNAGLVSLQTCAVLCRNTLDIFYSESFSVWPTFNAASVEFAEMEISWIDASAVFRCSSVDVLL